MSFVKLLRVKPAQKNTAPGKIDPKILMMGLHIKVVKPRLSSFTITGQKAKLV